MTCSHIIFFFNGMSDQIKESNYPSVFLLFYIIIFKMFTLFTTVKGGSKSELLGFF